MPGGPGGHAVVLGAGIQGTCTALALVQAGWTVDLLDRSPEPMLGASVRGEGKLHLGYVYANDPGGSTAALMVEGALVFSDLLDRWLPEPIDWSLLRSSPFLYAALPDSMVAVDALGEHYRWVDERVADRLRDGASYAGTTSLPPAEQVASPCEHGLSDDVSAFTTGEVAVDPMRLRRHLVDGLEATAVTFHPGTTVGAVERTTRGFVVSGTDGTDGEVTHRGDVVVNCLWDGRLAVDATLGIEPARPWIYRLKYAVHGTVPAGAPLPPSATLVLGPFGDVVRRADGRVYASWYPACLAGSSTELRTPSAWTPALSRDGGEVGLTERAVATVAALAEHVPAVEALEVDTVAAGVIVAWGESDIDQPDSELHHRHDIGVHDHDGYLSVDTGKLTTAPLFAQQVADLLAR